MKVLVTCPPMLGLLDELRGEFDRRGWTVTAPPVVQTLSEQELLELVPRCDGWIIGDDPATRRVLEAGLRGRLRAAVKWGVGVDNVDLAAARELGLPLTNTPGMLGDEVADVALGYVVALARDTFRVDREVRRGGWPKPRGISLAGRLAALVGFGTIGRALARRLLVVGMRVRAYDPAFETAVGLEEVARGEWPDGLEEADFLVLCCALTAENRHLVDTEVLARLRPGARLVNVARGPLVDEAALAAALAEGRLHSAALDVFEVEPLPAGSPLRRLENVVLGSHNASNTEDAVRRISLRAIELLHGFLEGKA